MKHLRRFLSKWMSQFRKDQMEAELKREINARVVAGFREAGIAFGIDPKTPATLSLNQGPL